MPASIMRRSPCAVSRSARRKVDEFELIRRYFARAGEAPGVIEGIGDDGAVLRPEPGIEVLPLRVFLDELETGL